MDGFGSLYVLVVLPLSVTMVHSYFKESLSKSRLPAAERLTFSGTVPPCTLAAACTSGVRLPELYSIRTSLELSLFLNQLLPYSRTYKSPFGPNLISIGSMGWYVGRKRSIDL